MSLLQILELRKKLVGYDTIPDGERDDFFCYLSIEQPLLREVVDMALESVLSPAAMQELRLDEIFDEVQIEKVGHEK